MRSLLNVEIVVDEGGKICLRDVEDITNNQSSIVDDFMSQTKRCQNITRLIEEIQI